MKNKWKVTSGGMIDLPWLVKREGHARTQDGKFPVWWIIAKFAVREDARLFVRALRESHRDPHSELIPKCMKKQKENPLWPSDSKLRDIARQLEYARRIQGR